MCSIGKKCRISGKYAKLAIEFPPLEIIHWCREPEVIVSMPEKDFFRSGRSYCYYREDIDMKKTMNMTGIEIQTLRSAYRKAYDLGREQHMYVMTDQLLHGKNSRGEWYTVYR